MVESKSKTKGPIKRKGDKAGRKLAGEARARKSHKASPAFLSSTTKVQGILASSCLELDPLAVIRLYSYRFRIESTFRELKQQTGAFGYRFWSKHMPKLGYYQKKGAPVPLEQVEDAKSRQNILKAVRATQMHMALSCIAIGILQILSITFGGELDSSQLRYQRTPSRGRVSEAALMHHMRKYLFLFMEKQP